MMNHFVLRQSLLLFLTATIWGVAFVAQSVGMEYVEPFTFNAVRNVIGAVLSAIGMFFFEEPKVSEIFAAWFPILYEGVMSSGVGYTLQIIGQKGMNPTVASLILSLESVVSLLAGWVILEQKLSPRELSGCALTFAAIIIVQLPSKKQQ